MAIGIEMVGIHVVEGGLLASGKLFDDWSAGDQIGTIEQIGLAEAAIEAGALGLEAEEREVAKPGIKPRLGIAVEIAPLGAGACSLDPRSSRSARQTKVIRGCASGSPLPGSPTSREQRGSASIAPVWADSIDTRISGAPSMSVATPTLLASGEPVPGSITASAPKRAPRISVFASLIASASVSRMTSFSRSTKMAHHVKLIFLLRLSADQHRI